MPKQTPAPCLFVDPEGREYHFPSIKDGCLALPHAKLSYAEMYAIAKGRAKTHRGWKCYYVNGRGKAIIPEFISRDRRRGRRYVTAGGVVRFKLYQDEIAAYLEWMNAKKRRCLRCSREFASYSFGERVCEPCRNSESWRLCL